MFINNHGTGSRSRLAVVGAPIGVSALGLSGCFSPREVTATPLATSTVSAPTTNPAPATTTPSEPAPTTAPAPGTTTGAPAATTTNTARETSTGSGSSATTSRGAASAPRCNSSGTDVTAVIQNGSAGAGSFTVQIITTNTGGQSCQLIGFPGVSMVTGDSGKQLGKPADRDGARGAGAILAPGQSANAAVRVSQAANYDPCTPTDAKGLRIYLPGETRSQFAPLDGLVGCSDAAAPSIMKIKAFGQ